MPVRVVDSSPLLAALPGANRARGTSLLSLSHMLPSARAKLIVRAVARRTIGSYDNVASTAVSL
jgi:hypothetical protein